MRRIVKVGKAVVGALVLTGVALFGAAKIWPDRVAQGGIKIYAATAGLHYDIAQTELGPIHYLEGGQGEETVVLLHGLFARKEHWIKLARTLTTDYRVIIPDIPGFGENTAIDPERYRYAEQVKNLRLVFDGIGLDHFHLAGNSMGGQLAGLIALAMPEQVLSVSFVGSPVGVTAPRESPFEAAMREDAYTLVVSNMAVFDQRNTYLFPEQPFVPAVIETYWADQEIAQHDFNQQIWDKVTTSNDQPLQEIAPLISQPGHVIWCLDDAIFDHSGAAVLVNALQNAELTSLENCGHLPMIDAPQAAGRALRQFLDDL